MAYTFSGSKYITSGVAENFPIELQVALFSAVEQMREKVSGQLDYLQVFEIVTEVKRQKKFLHIYHMQECPEAKLEYFIPTDVEVNGRAYLIDDVDHITLNFHLERFRPREYVCGFHDSISQSCWKMRFFAHPALGMHRRPENLPPPLQGTEPLSESAWRRSRSHRVGVRF